MKNNTVCLSVDESRRRFIRDFLAFTGWSFLGAAELVRSSPLSIAGDPNNADKAWGGIKGRILFDGTPPERKEVDLGKTNLGANDLTWFKSTGPILNEEWVVDPKSKAVQWVVVWLLPEDPKGTLLVHDSRKVIKEKEKAVIVDQAPKGYVPHTVALRTGQDLVMKNTGPVAHVFQMGEGSNNPGFNRAMPPQSEIKVPDLKAERHALQVGCPPHPWERMWLKIFDHPYFAVTKPDGSFEIPLAPAGKNRLVVWHEAIGYKGGKDGRNGSVITIEGGAVTDLGTITIKPVAS
ncbi:MAG: hypothetical protein U0798_17390 [Gemmataceae bacterium]